MTDLSELRQLRAKLLAKYQNPFEALISLHEAAWRKEWSDACAASGKFVPFEEWFYTEDADGVSPFEAAGGWFHDRTGHDGC